jgi:hypothetical protein
VHLKNQAPQFALFTETFVQLTIIIAKEAGGNVELYLPMMHSMTAITI